MAIRNGLLAASGCVLVLLGTGLAAAQTPPPRDIPEGFVLPGPPPTNAPPSTGSAPEAVPSSPGAATAPGTAVPTAPGSSAAPSAINPPSVSGAMVTAPSSLAPTVGTTQAIGAAPSSAGQHQWPCVQRKIDTVTAGQVWSGPPLDDARSVPRTAAMRQLIASVVARRLPVAEAEKAAVDFVKALPEGEREATATALFADILRMMDAERAEVMRGIERYGARQQQLAVRLRERNAELGEIRAKGDMAETNQATEALLWDTRVFDERRQSLTYVCEVPILIEQRLFALGRAIGGSL